MLNITLLSLSTQEIVGFRKWLGKHSFPTNQVNFSLIQKSPEQPYQLIGLKAAEAKARTRIIKFLNLNSQSQDIDVIVAVENCIFQSKDGNVCESGYVGIYIKTWDNSISGKILSYQLRLIEIDNEYAKKAHELSNQQKSVTSQQWGVPIGSVIAMQNPDCNPDDYQGFLTQGQLTRSQQITESLDGLTDTKSLETNYLVKHLKFHFNLDC